MNAIGNPVQMLQFITQPAFLVKNGVITEINDAAASRQINVGASIYEMITFGSDDYKGFASGKLYLSLNVGMAWVSICNGFHLFTLEDSFSSPELRAFALAAQHLRAPLSNAVSGMEFIMQETDSADAELKEQLSQINRSLYQMIRAVCNMSDVSQIGITNRANIKLCNARQTFGEIFEKATNLTENTGHSIQFRNLKQDVECDLDSSLIERAVLNMISNAIKFSSAGSCVSATLKLKGNRLALTIENSIQDGQSRIFGNAFNRFLREPGIESNQIGIGLGMSIISRAASVHNGTILLNLSRNGIVKITLSVPTHTTNVATAKSPIILLDGYTGGLDNYLVELSDILPNSLYKII